MISKSSCALNCCLVDARKALLHGFPCMHAAEIEELERRAMNMTNALRGGAAHQQQRHNATQSMIPRIEASIYSLIDPAKCLGKTVA